MTITSKPHILRTAALLSIGAAMALSACGSSSDIAAAKAGPSTTIATSAAPSTSSRTITTTSPSTTTEPESEQLTREEAQQELDILAVYSDFWKNYLAVGKGIATIDTAAIRPQLARYATGDVLDKLDGFFTVNRQSGFVMRDGINLKFTVVALGATMAQVRDCQDDQTGLYRTDGSRVDWETPLRQKLLTTLVLEGGVWKVSEISNEGQGCVA